MTSSGNVIFAYPGELSTNTGGYAYDRQVITHLGGLGWSVSPMPLGHGFPFPRESVQLEAEKKLDSLPESSLILIDGLAFGILHEWAERNQHRQRIIALVHHPLSLETGLEPADKLRLEVSERLALRCARHVVVTSTATARTLEASYDVPSEKISVAVPGTERPTVAPTRDELAHIVSVGTLTRRKGHDILLRALAEISDLPWRATIAGSDELDKATARELRNLRRDFDLEARVDMPGALADVGPLMASADLFVLASRYEGYGMVFAEALSYGLPIIACRAGAVPEVVPHDGGILVEVDDVQAFGHAMRRLLTDGELRKNLARGSAEAGARLPGWKDTAGIISRKLKEYA